MQQPLFSFPKEPLYWPIGKKEGKAEGCSLFQDVLEGYGSRKEALRGTAPLSGLRLKGPKS